MAANPEHSAPLAARPVVRRRTRSMPDAERARIIRRLRRLAWLLDSSIQIPGTKFSVGIDPLVSLLPGVGDVAMMAVSAYILVEGRRLGASPATLAKMAVNVLADAAMGAVPIAGDIADAMFKANQRNLKLLGIEPLPPGGAE